MLKYCSVQPARTCGMDHAYEYMLQALSGMAVVASLLHGDGASMLPVQGQLNKVSQQLSRYTPYAAAGARILARPGHMC
jgi:hypothetical protein